MLRSIRVDADKCTGCMQCELACSFEKLGLFNPARSRIKVFQLHGEGRCVPYTCTQCSDAWCQNACPVGAITADETTGARLVDEQRCVGCKVCTIACPFGTVNFDRASGKVHKCDLCSGDPACVHACPTGALAYVDANWTGYDKMQKWAAKTDASAQSEA